MADGGVLMGDVDSERIDRVVPSYGPDQSLFGPADDDDTVAFRGEFPGN